MIKIGNFESLPSEINDPFKKECIKSVSIYVRKSLFDEDKIVMRSTVEFKSGNTTGSQQFEDTDFEKLIIKTVSFINQL